MSNESIVQLYAVLGLYCKLQNVSRLISTRDLSLMTYTKISMTDLSIQEAMVEQCWSTYSEAQKSKIEYLLQAIANLRIAQHNLILQNKSPDLIKSYCEQDLSYSQELSVLITEHYTQWASEIEQFLDMIQGGCSGFILAS